MAHTDTETDTENGLDFDVAFATSPSPNSSSDGQGQGPGHVTRAAEPQRRSTRGPLYDAAPLGFRHYWYPALLSRHLGKKPQGIKMLGEDLVFVRAQGTVFALFDRCAHRGMKLSAGTCWSDGTLTCPYHGWTYDVRDGHCVAALTDGVDSPLIGQRGKSVRSYPVQERNGIIFVYMGDGNPPPLEADVPEEVLRPDWTFQVVVSVWNGNWRASVENGFDAGHAPYVHRYSWRWRTVMQLQPAWSQVGPAQEIGPYLRVGRGAPGPSEAFYPGVGWWPRYSWLRRQLARLGDRTPSHRRTTPNEFRLPCLIHNKYYYCTHVRWAVPVDAETTRNFQVYAGQYQGARSKAFSLHYWLWHRWIWHMGFNGQDKNIVELLDYEAPEQLYRPDRSIVDLRRYIESHVRTADPGREVAEVPGLELSRNGGPAPAPAPAPHPALVR